jgi:hypothetical protein
MMTEKSPHEEASILDELVARCVQDLEPLAPREAVRKYPLLALVAARVLPGLTAEQLATVVSLASNPGLTDASQECRSCSAASANGNLCLSCYESVLGDKLNLYA